MTLYLQLRDGFEHDTVTVRVNGNTVYQQTDLTTDLSISCADNIEVYVPDEYADLEIDVHNRMTTHKRIHLTSTPYVEVRILNDEMLVIASGEITPLL